MGQLAHPDRIGNNGWRIQVRICSAERYYVGSSHGPRSQYLSPRATVCREATWASRQRKPRANMPGAFVLRRSGVVAGLTWFGRTTPAPGESGEQLRLVELGISQRATKSLQR